MSEVPLSRRAVILLVVVLVSLVTASCTLTTSQPKPRDLPRHYEPGAEVFCKAGNNSPSRPLICVNEQTLQAMPDPAPVYDFEAKDHYPTTKPVVVHWFTQRSANLQIRFTESGCVGRVKCDGLGHCWAKVRPLDTEIDKGKHKPKACKYELNIDGKVVDPLLDVNPCCWVTDDLNR